MQENIKELYNKDNLTQKDIIQLLLHNAQHMVTRDELKEDNRELKQDLKEDIVNVKSELKEDIANVKSELKEDIANLDRKIDSVEEKLNKKIDSVEEKLEGKIEKINSKFDRLQWLIVATIVSVFLKDYILELIHKLFQ